MRIGIDGYRIGENRWFRRRTQINHSSRWQNPRNSFVWQLFILKIIEVLLIRCGSEYMQIWNDFRAYSIHAMKTKTSETAHRTRSEYFCLFSSFFSFANKFLLLYKTTKYKSWAHHQDNAFSLFICISICGALELKTMESKTRNHLRFAWLALHAFNKKLCVKSGKATTKKKMAQNNRQQEWEREKNERTINRKTWDIYSKESHSEMNPFTNAEYRAHSLFFISQTRRWIEEKSSRHSAAAFCSGVLFIFCSAGVTNHTPSKVLQEECKISDSNCDEGDVNSEQIDGGHRAGKLE